MGFFDKLKKSEGGYIFLSHSHADIEKVREIRNSLEKDGFEPLCFFLKCLNASNEIEDLIKREIDAREWFVYIDSENARASRWVRMEREYIESTNSKKIITVDLENEEAVADAIRKISHNLRIFMSYSSRDEVIARKIKDKLEEKDYLVFFDIHSIPAGESYGEKISSAITEASKDGCVLLLLTKDYVKSRYVTKEIEKAIAENGTIVPVMLGNFELPIEFEFYLSNIRIYHLSENPEVEEIDNMIEMLGRYILNK